MTLIARLVLESRAGRMGVCGWLNASSPTSGLNWSRLRRPGGGVSHNSSGATTTPIVVSECTASPDLRPSVSTASGLHGRIAPLRGKLLRGTVTTLPHD
jgi:hypothetical protein